jgi:hypothetical protein
VAEVLAVGRVQLVRAVSADKLKAIHPGTLVDPLL